MDPGDAIVRHLEGCAHRIGDIFDRSVVDVVDADGEPADAHRKALAVPGGFHATGFTDSCGRGPRL